MIRTDSSNIVAKACWPPKAQPNNWPCCQKLTKHGCSSPPALLTLLGYLPPNPIEHSQQVHTGVGESCYDVLVSEQRQTVHVQGYGLGTACFG